MAKKAKLEAVDGFGPKERKRLTSAIRQVWYQCRARKLALARCMGKDGFPCCPKCGLTTPRIQIDHIEPVGAIESEGAILRMFCPSVGLRGLCRDCHTLVTNLGRTSKRKKKQFCDT
jgi:hypothetical protein